MCEIWMFGMWYVRYVGYLRCAMFGMWDVGCQMFGMWDVQDVGCFKCRTLGI